MFNKVFNSFHDTVAEAKADREQLDRLLSISTLRERALLLATVVLWFVSIAWIVFATFPYHLNFSGTISSLSTYEEGELDENFVPIQELRVIVPDFGTIALDSPTHGLEATISFQDKLGNEHQVAAYLFAVTSSLHTEPLAHNFVFQLRQRLVLDNVRMTPCDVTLELKPRSLAELVVGQLFSSP